MTVVRYINNELYDVGSLPFMEVENPILLQMIRNVQLRIIEEKKGQEKTEYEKIFES